MRLPRGWKLITQDFPFELDENESVIKLVSVFVPQAATAGLYEITYRVTGRKYPSVSDFFTTQIAVLPSLHLDVQLLEAPEYVIAGDDYRISFVVSNGCNIVDRVYVRIENKENYPASFVVEDFSMTPIRSKKITVTIKTDGTITDRMRHTIRLIAQLRKNEQIQSVASSSVEILPRKMGVEDPFRRLPVTVALSHVVQKDDDMSSGFQGNIFGEGTLDEEGDKHIRFRFRGPDIFERSFLAEHDEYFVSYWTKNTMLHFGDRVFSLSPLTENSRYGRGGEGRIVLRHFTFGAFYQKARWIRPTREEMASYVRYSIDRKLRIGLNFLRKKIDAADGKDDVVSLDGHFEPVKNTEVEVEYALGKKEGLEKSAYRVQISGHRPRVFYQFNLIRAQPDFPGYYNDTNFLAGSLSFELNKNLRINGGVREERQNIDVDTTRYTAPFDKFYQMGLQYRWKSGTAFALDYLDRSREDRMIASKFNYREKTFRFRMDQHCKNLSLSASGEIGTTWNRLADGIFRMERYNVSVFFRPTNRQSYRGYIYYTNDGRTVGEKRRQLTVGVNLSVQFSDRTDLHIHLQNYYSPEEYLRDRNICEVRLNHTFTNDHQFSVRGRYTLLRNFVDRGETAVLVEYKIPLGIPMGKKKGLCLIEGHVFNAETREPVKNAILRINGFTAVTNERGYFVFPSLKPGLYCLAIDKACIGLNRIVTQRLPAEVTVQEGEKKQIDFGIVRSAELSGRIIVGHAEDTSPGEEVNDDDHKTDDGFYIVGSEKRSTEQLKDRQVSPVQGLKADEESGVSETRGLAGILVELMKDGMVLRRVSGEDGSFLFEELHPGRWTVKIYAYHLPENHFLERDMLAVDLQPGEKRDLSMKVLPKKRNIRMVQDGGTLLEEAPSPLSSNGTQDDYDLGLQMFQKGQYKEAVRIFEQVLIRSSDERMKKNCRYWMGKCYNALGEYGKAIDAFNAVIKN
ncbi:MAG: tetratricopeptide repeat protein [bacterium]